VFDLGSTMKSAGILRDRIQAGRVTGPRILTVGEPFYPPGGTPVYAKPIYEAHHLPSAEITDATEAVRRVEAQIGAGAEAIKLFTASIEGGNAPQVYMAAADVRAITSEAHKLRRQTFAHPTDAKGVELAVDNGVDILAHVDPLGGPWSLRLVAKLKARHIGLIPTLMLFQVYPDPRTPIEVGLRQVAAQVKARGDILFGTDAGFMEVYDPTQEYLLMRRAMSWRAILASLTTTPAHRFGFKNRLGRVQPGFLADLTLLASDPASDVAAFAHVRAVIKAGEPIYIAPSDEGPSNADRGSAYTPYPR
jgi:imidazolonepropionase-like amidohydrolase